MRNEILIIAYFAQTIRRYNHCFAHLFLPTTLSQPHLHHHRRCSDLKTIHPKPLVDLTGALLSQPQALFTGRCPTTLPKPA